MVELRWPLCVHRMHRNAQVIALAAMLAAEIAAFAIVPPSSRLHPSRRATEEEIAWMLDDDNWDEEDDDEAFDEQMRVRAAAEHASYASRTTPLAPATDAGARRVRGACAQIRPCLACSFSRLPAGPRREISQ